MRQDFIDYCQGVIEEDLTAQRAWLAQHLTPALLIAPTIGIEKGDHFSALAVARQTCCAASVSITEDEAALARISNGTYGICAVCGQEILEERLECVPRATHCVQCKPKDTKGNHKIRYPVI